MNPDFKYLKADILVRLTILLELSFVMFTALFTASAEEEHFLKLTPQMLTSSSPLADFSGLIDEQEKLPPTGKPEKGWKINSQYWKRFPFSATIDLGESKPLNAFWIFDTFGTGEVVIEVFSTESNEWTTITNYGCDKFMAWTRVPIERMSSKVRITLKSPGAGIAEVALSQFTPNEWEKVKKQQEEKNLAAKEREMALQKAREELSARPWIEIPPFGLARLVDEVNCGEENPEHLFTESPSAVSELQIILGRKCRVLKKTADECAFMAFRMGKFKLLTPGKDYVLVVEYPEDNPRAYIVMNGGNETSRGFHTGATTGDALHPKYVNNNCESLRLPLSGKYERWTLYFNLHDRFPELGFIRGAGERKLTADDGFPVIIAQFSERNDPVSRGAAVSRILLYEVKDKSALIQPLKLPPQNLPHRRIFWREEMADGVIDSARENERGVKEPLDWYKFKVNQMQFLGINTFCKDLLEFGACQHWDPTAYGGNNWVFFAERHKNLWGQIVELMSKNKFDLLPYYEYSGSKGYKGLGNQRRCKPLGRNDAYTHISWIESANADITDPDTYEDFKKILDLTVLKFNSKANFAGIWLRPRSQLPISFSDAALTRFAKETNREKIPTRVNLIADKKLYEDYKDWWFGKRQQFITSMRDYLRTNGITNAFALFTTEASEPGPSFPDWDKKIVTDDVPTWQKILSQPQHIIDGRKITPVSTEYVLEQKLYEKALTSAPLPWGNWEPHHASPPADPLRYNNVDGAMLTYGFNRLYTVASSDALDLFRTASGLAIVRHYPLNEDMMFDKNGRPKLGYFIADVERSGPFCMMAEAMAVAKGDPSMIGYLMGGNYGRGFPDYVRNFNANFLALPALPSKLLQNLCDDSEIVVREITTQSNGVWLAIVNTGWYEKKDVKINLKGYGVAHDAIADEILTSKSNSITLNLYPFQLKTIKIER